MYTPKTVVIVHNSVDNSSSPDELDVLAQVDAVSNALDSLDFLPVPLAVTLNLEETASRLKELNPYCAFNLFESVESTGRFITFAPAVLDHLRIPYTGAGTSEIFVTTSKVLTKERLMHMGLPTPRWTTIDNILKEPEAFPFPCIVKPIFEDASVGLDSDSVCHDLTTLKQRMNEYSGNIDELFVEEFVDGREFNISILASPQGPEVMPHAEIQFLNFPKELPRMVGYRAKWDEQSFEAQHTVRRFQKTEKDKALVSAMTEISLDCWQTFNLRGYARVDFRVRANGQPEVLEINANPCISPDSGFVAACNEAKIGYVEMVQRILMDVRGLNM
ncbi:MAG: ATP-grasp domain-containing protein [Deltaproteobacteria bacterium]|nr:ATP-grasp domain-containing protein [Deltaproteobacteria bacterium]